MYQGTLDNAAPVYLAIAEHCGIQIQHPKPESYHGPLARFRDGGSTLIGFFGHCHVTNQRGKWDPGLAVFDEVLDKQCNSLAFDFERGEDIAFWKDIQSRPQPPRTQALGRRDPWEGNDRGAAARGVPERHLRAGEGVRARGDDRSLRRHIVRAELQRAGFEGYYATPTRPPRRKRKRSWLARLLAG
jgi:hypothetical protein